MPLEIERKFLVLGTTWRTENGSHYRQGYLNQDKERTVRVRLTEKQSFICVKGNTKGMSRVEYEYEIPKDEAEEMLKICEGQIIEKVRHIVIHKGLKWDIDEFLGDNKGLIIAEVELDSEDQVFEKPEWLGAEVTSDPRYFNSNLATTPYNTWHDKNNL